MSIITYPLNGIQYTAEDAETYLSTRESGVFSEDIDIVAENMTVTVGSFLAWIKNTDFSGKSVANTEPVTLTISPAESVLDRIDRIVLRFDATYNSSSLIVLKGVASSNPVGAEISRTEIIYDLCLAEIYISSGQTNIKESDIHSTILDEDLCGIMRDGITGIPTHALQREVELIIKDLREAIQNVKNESAFMLKDIYDPEEKNKKVAFADEVINLDGGGLVKGRIGTYDGEGERRSFFEMIGEDAVVSNQYYDERADYSAIYIKDPVTNNQEDLVALKFRKDLEDSEEMRLFGEHNKPSGTYVGNGNEASRTIKIGGFSNSVQTIIIGSSNGFAIVHGIRGSIVKAGESLRALKMAQAKISNGTLTLATTDECLNASGTNYFYSVL